LHINNTHILDILDIFCSVSGAKIGNEGYLPYTIRLESGMYDRHVLIRAILYISENCPISNFPYGSYRSHILKKYTALDALVCSVANTGCIKDNQVLYLSENVCCRPYIGHDMQMVINVNVK
jgi:hypothetical protein